jgi:hypothetical protein
MLSCLDGDDFTQMYNWRKHIIRDEYELSQYLESPDRPRPYQEPTLVRRPEVYADFLAHLDAAGMLGWRRGGGSLLGVFLLQKRTASFA